MQRKVLIGYVENFKGARHLERPFFFLIGRLRHFQEHKVVGLDLCNFAKVFLVEDCLVSRLGA